MYMPRSPETVKTKFCANTCRIVEHVRFDCHHTEAICGKICLVFGHTYTHIDNIRHTRHAGTKKWFLRVYSYTYKHASMSTITDLGTLPYVGHNRQTVFFAAPGVIRCGANQAEISWESNRRHILVQINKVFVLLHYDGRCFKSIFSIKKNSSLNSESRIHQCEICSKRFIQIYFFCTQKKRNTLGKWEYPHTHTLNIYIYIYTHTCICIYIHIYACM